MKIFTLHEANAMLAAVEPKLRRLRDRYASIAEMRSSASIAALMGTDGGGGMEGGTAYVRALYQIGQLTSEIDDLGIQLKDYNRGLIDFPSMMEGRVILLCWQLDEGPEIKWWHELDSGFASRRPL